MNKLYIVGESDYDHYDVIAIFSDEASAQELATVLNRRSRILERLRQRIETKVELWKRQNEDLYQKDSSEFFHQEYAYKFELMDRHNEKLQKLRLKIDKMPVRVFQTGMTYRVREIPYLMSTKDWEWNNEDSSNQVLEQDQADE